MRRPAVALAAALSVALAACEKPEFEPPDRAEQVREADAEFSMAVFDSVAWPSDSIRALEGNVVYATSCRNCHGPLGAGGTDYALERNLAVPSLVAPEWRYARAPDSIRHRIFVGHVRGMPTWGVAGLTPREIDAVAHYIDEVLRPELLGDGG
ncbi:MAG: cytochrome c [Longimicrobiales bacterium]